MQAQSGKPFAHCLAPSRHYLAPACAAGLFTCSCCCCWVCASPPSAASSCCCNAAMVADCCVSCASEEASSAWLSAYLTGQHQDQHVCGTGEVSVENVHGGRMVCRSTWQSRRACKQWLTLQQHHSTPTADRGCALLHRCRRHTAQAPRMLRWPAYQCSRSLSPSTSSLCRSAWAANSARRDATSWLSPCTRGDKR